MKKLHIKFSFLFLLLITSFIHVFAQDTLFFKNSTKTIAIIKEVSPTEIQYKKMEMPDGPMYIVSKNDIEKIIYKNGYIDVLKPSTIEPVTQPFVVTYSAAPPLSVGKESITYDDTKRKYSYLIRLVDQHPDANIKPNLMRTLSSMRNLKAGQDATRTVSIVFGGITIGTGALAALIYAFDNRSGESFAVLPMVSGSVALLTAAASIAFNINLRGKRHEFVKLYNQ